jgi:acylphosphatase
MTAGTLKARLGTAAVVALLAACADRPAPRGPTYQGVPAGWDRRALDARHLRIEGRVQGVGYRDWMVRQASRLGLHGWVRNRGDGSVEAVVAGDEASVRALVSACQRGPLLARVDRVAEGFAEPPAEPGFRRLPDL